MDTNQKVLLIDSATGFYKIERYPVGAFFGPVDTLNSMTSWSSSKARSTCSPISTSIHFPW